VAAAAIVSVAVRLVADTSVTFDTVMPVPLRLSVEPVVKPVPVIVTDTAAPRAL
jgi:hypothetical protein